jgi:hypothetical protein
MFRSHEIPPSAPLRHLAKAREVSAIRHESQVPFMIVYIFLIFLAASLPGMSAPTIHIEKKGLTNAGSGTANDPYNVSSTERLQTIVDQAPDGTTLKFGKGVFPLELKVRKTLTLIGQGDGTILQATRAGQDAIRFSGRESTLTIRNLLLRQSGGWEDSADVSAGILLTSAANGVILDSVVFRDFYNGVYTSAPIRRLVVTNCQFLYTYGRAGVSNSPPFQHPAVAILGSGSEETIVRDCYFDGLLHPTFHGLKGNPPKSQRTPMDGLYKTGGGNPKRTFVENNVVRNHGIEGILCERIDFTGEYSTCVRGNKITGPSYKEPSFYGNYCPAIAIVNTQGAEISGNLIEKSPLGIDITFSVWADSNACLVRNNAILNVNVGARIRNGGSKTLFCRNRVFCSSEPTKSLHSVEIEWCGLMGVAASGTPVIRSNSLRATEPAWDAEIELISRDMNQFSVSSTEGIHPKQGVLISLSPRKFSYFPVQGVSGKTIMVSPEWAATASSLSSGKLVYARKLGNFTGLGAVCSFGDSSKVVVENNHISGFLQDVASSNGGVVIFQNNQTSDVLFLQPSCRYFQKRFNCP